MIVRMANVNKIRTKGRVYYYHRKTGARLPDDPRSFEFLAAWQAEEAKIATPAAPAPGTLGGLMAAYRMSPDFAGLADRTKADYNRVMNWLKLVDDMPLHKLNSAMVIGLRDRAFTAHKRRFANYVRDVLSRLSSWGKPRGFTSGNPAEDVEQIRRPRNAPEANRPWKPEELAAVIEAASPPIRAAVALGAFAALREGDVVRLPWSAYDGSAIESRHRKTGEPVWVPVTAELRAVLEQTPKTSPLIVVGRKGGFTESGFRASFFKLIRQLKDAGTVGPGLTFHGLRHTAATALADAGCDTRDIMAVTGHATEAMVRRYTEKADKRKRAKAAIAKLDAAKTRTD